MSDMAAWCILLSGVALGGVMGALAMAAHAWDMGYRAGRLEERYRIQWGGF